MLPKDPVKKNETMLKNQIKTQNWKESKKLKNCNNWTKLDNIEKNCKIGQNRKKSKKLDKNWKIGQN